MASHKVPSLDFPDIADIYDRFAALTADSPECGGLLVVYAGLDRGGSELAIATNIAGATSLGLEQDLARAKAAIRNGACDFLVNTLDEALRILKNEIRKKGAVAVVLVGDPQGLVEEMVERGVQPEAVDGGMPGMEVLEARGARRLGPTPDWGVAVAWSVEQEPMRWLPVVDRLAAEALDPADRSTAARQRWIEGSPRHLGRALAGQRYVRMSEAEAERFGDAVRRSGIGAVVRVSR